MTGFGPGYHGKLPSRGDFVAYGLPRDFLDSWDAWLATVLVQAEHLLGEAWDPLFAGSPVWRFVLGRGLCGEAAAAGVLVPSIDRVGRLYPFMAAASLRDDDDPAAVPAACAGWFGRVESLLLDVVARPEDIDGLPARVAALGRPEPHQGPQGGADHRAVVEDLVGPLPERPSVWWTRGRGRVEASILACPGLPGGRRFAAFFDNGWTRGGWEDLDEPPLSAVSEG